MADGISFRRHVDPWRARVGTTGSVSNQQIANVALTMITDNTIRQRNDRGGTPSVTGTGSSPGTTTTGASSCPQPTF